MRSSIEGRIRALEQRSVPAGRLIVVRSIGDHSDAEIDEELRRNGLTRRKSDDLMVFVTIYETREGGIDQTGRTLDFVSCVPLKARRV